MDKLTYLAELAEGLARWVPERERQEILRYYAEYFEEAGPDREAQVVQELGDPWALSCRLAVEGGYVTQEAADSWTPKKKKLWPWVLIGTAAVLVFVVGSVASAASRVGRIVGQVVFSNVAEDVVQAVPSLGVVTVVEGEASVYDVPADSGIFGSVEDGSMDAFDSIDVDISLGNVSVVAGDDYTLYVDQDMDLNGYGLTWEVKGGTLKLRDSISGKQVQIDGWDGLEKLFGQRIYGLEVTITVPEGTDLEKIVVKTGMGNVTLYDVAAAKMTAETGMGDVGCYDVRYAEKIDLDTGMGSIDLALYEPYSGVDIDLESGMGSVTANLGGSEQDWAYELESGMGTVTVDCVGRGSKAERKGDAPYKLDAESGMGDVDVYFE